MSPCNLGFGGKETDVILSAWRGEKYPNEWKMIPVINFPDIFITVLSWNICEGDIDEAVTIFYI